jgi:hypothetical protein
VRSRADPFPTSTPLPVDRAKEALRKFETVRPYERGLNMADIAAVLSDAKEDA